MSKVQNLEKKHKELIEKITDYTNIKNLHEYCEQRIKDKRQEYKILKTIKFAVKSKIPFVDSTDKYIKNIKDYSEKFKKIYSDFEKVKLAKIRYDNELYQLEKLINGNLTDLSATKKYKLKSPNIDSTTKKINNYNLEQKKFFLGGHYADYDNEPETVDVLTSMKLDCEEILKDGVDDLKKRLKKAEDVYKERLKKVKNLPKKERKEILKKLKEDINTFKKIYNDRKEEIKETEKNIKDFRKEVAKLKKLEQELNKLKNSLENELTKFKDRKYENINDRNEEVNKKLNEMLDEFIKAKKDWKWE